MKTPYLLILAGSLAINLNATVIFNDSFADGNPASTGAGQTNWYNTTGPGALEATAGSLGLVTGPIGNALHTTFSMQSLSATGDNLALTATFTTPATVGSVSNGLRIGLFNSGGGSFAQDFATSTDPAWATTSGYVLVLDANKADASDNVTFYEVGPGGNTTRLLSSTSGWTYGANGTSDNYSLLANTTYTVDMSVARTDEFVVTLSASLKQGATTLSTHSYDAISFSISDYDLLGIYAQANTFGSSSDLGSPDNGLEFSNITLTSVPEPATTVAVLGVIALLVVRFGRRKPIA